MVVYVEGKRCTGYELCIDSLPGVFRMNSDGASEVRNSSGASAGVVRGVTESCPAECILHKK